MLRVMMAPRQSKMQLESLPNKRETVKKGETSKFSQEIYLIKVYQEELRPQAEAFWGDVENRQPGYDRLP